MSEKRSLEFESTTLTPATNINTQTLIEGTTRETGVNMWHTKQTEKKLVLSRNLTFKVVKTFRLCPKVWNTRTWVNILFLKLCSVKRCSTIFKHSVLQRVRYKFFASHRNRFPILIVGINAVLCYIIGQLQSCTCCLHIYVPHLWLIFYMLIENYKSVHKIVCAY